jgi:AraC family transcriptional regulator
MSRIMMMAAGHPRPLRLGGSREGPLLVSASTPWAGLPLEEHRFGTSEGVGRIGPLDGEHGLLMLMEGRIDLVVRNAGRDVRYTGRPSSVSLLAGDRRREVLSIRGSARAVAVHIPREWFAQLGLARAPEAYGEGEPYLPDTTAHNLVRAMRDEVALGAPTGRLFAESLSLALLSYVVERVPGTCYQTRGQLGGAQRRQLQRYIRDRLHEDLSLAELADVVALSPRHFSKLFRAAFGTTPHRYVLQERLAEGARLLARGGQDVLEIALRLGFCSQSHFTAAFRQAFGVTPYRYAAGKRTST